MSVVLEEVVDRIRVEYLDMPGLRLTAAQTQRLCGVDTATCEAALQRLVASGFLRRDVAGAYIRTDAGA